MTAPPQERYQPKLFTGSSHWWARGILMGIPPTSRVLDIGSGSGVMGRILREHGVTDITAVEIDAAARDHVRDIYRRIEPDLEAVTGETFDAALLLDVLEHVDAPTDFLSSVSTLIKPGGSILLSVPNIAHWSVRFGLLCGFFEPTERGILDKTHRHFFTARRVTQMIAARPHLEFIERSASISPAQFVLPRWMCDNAGFEAFSRLRLTVAQALPGIGAYQHLAHIRVKSPAPAGSQRLHD